MAKIEVLKKKDRIQGNRNDEIKENRADKKRFYCLGWLHQHELITVLVGLLATDCTV
ncbi:hypothetical protein [Planktothrix sp. FACHB-1365]|uniref:hypothetical protein n=1 Tax=Planktothrix sp. FACHB-1365 TaxID=2692855 RepID=UPI00168226E5|nr:hypothetical protein [Planktothrix sp. FACHB-1365]MBD2482084.1 hypothetical protein [Planktothrix sp. FACHB-1365]